MRSKFMRIMTAAFAALMLIMTMLPLSAFAATEVTMDLSKAEISQEHTLTDADGNAFTSAYGLQAKDNPYGYELRPYLRKMHDYVAKSPTAPADKNAWVYGKDYVYCFCIENGIPLPDKNNYSGSSNPTHGNKYEMLSENQKSLLSLALAYGYTNRTDLQTSKDANACYSATQLIIWQITFGIRTSPTELNDKTYPADGYTGTMTEQYTRNKYLKDYYDRILSDMATHYIRPSFTSNTPAAAKTYEMEYTDGRYTVTLTDTNNVLSKYSVTTNGGVSVSVSSNRLTVSSAEPLNDAVTVKLNRRMPSTTHTTGFLIWSVPGKENANQDMVSGVPADNDPVPSYLKISAAAGSVKIVKTSEDGVVDGVRFTVAGNEINQTVTTQNGGVIQIDNLRPGSYTVTELADDRYETQAAQTVTIVSGKTSTVTFNNTLRRGDLKVTKTSEDGLVEGMKFHLYGTSYSGIPVDEYAVTDASGVATFSNILIGTGYTLEEVDTPIRYVVPDNQTAAIEWNKVTNKSFDNVLKKWNLTVTKQDVETGSAQGDATLAGAKYGIYKGDELIDTYVTDADGKFTTKYYICGNDWSIKELDSSEGYLVTPGNEQIGVDPKNYTAEYNSEAMKQYEQVKKGNIAIIKHTDDGRTQIETPEEGAEFAVYLGSAGSYENAKDSERDYLVCDEYGFAQTKDLPYGRYTVRQIKGWEGRELLKPFDVFVSENGETYRYLINNANFYSYVKVVKIDSTTGKTIPASGIGFHIYDPSGNQIQMTFTYPTVTTIDTFYTDGDGMLITPEKLEYGKGYSLVEVSAPYGYVLNSDPVYFDITEDNSTEETAVTVVVVTKENKPQMGVINVEKTGEYLASVVDAEDSKRLVYAVGGLAGAEYTVSAAEDIYTPDGTLRYSKDEVVATLVTKEDGKAVTEPLFLGRYHVVETKAPYGMTINSAVQTVELTYAGQEVEITETSAGFCNERQRIEINLFKVMEENEFFGVGNNDEITSVNFGLFAAEEIVAADGSSIPAGWVLEVVECDENGYAAFSTDLPVGAKTYVKEISTDKHYVLSDKEYPVVFEYAGQEVAAVHITVNDGKDIPNELIYGTVKGYKVNRETGEKISGALFGLFRENETSFTEDTAILTAESGEDGVFTFENVVYSSFVVRELRPAAGYLENETVYPVTVDENGAVVEITVVNDLIPEIGTTATINGEKEVCAAEVFTLTDTVEYKHLVPGKEYTVKGILMDKATGEPFLQNGEQITSEVTFVPEAPSGSVEVLFSIDAKLIKKDTDIVVFESLYSDSKELTVHADIDDEDQTVTVTLPPDVPQTGDNSNPGVWIGLGGAALGGAIACVIMFFKKKKDDEE